jgi:hypothetical protein
MAGDAHMMSTDIRVGLVLSILQRQQIVGVPPRDFPMPDEEFWIIDGQERHIPAAVIGSSRASIMLRMNNGRVVSMRPWKVGDMPPSLSTPMHFTNWTVDQIVDPPTKE